MTGTYRADCLYFALMFSLIGLWGPEHDPIIKNCSRGPGQDHVNKNCPRKKRGGRSVCFSFFIEIKFLYPTLSSMAAAAHAGCTTPPVP